MPAVLGTCADLAYGDYSTSTGYANLVGQMTTFDDVDLVATTVTKNSNFQRDCVLVKNGSVSAISAGAALNFVATYFGTQVQACPIGSAIRCYAPAYVRGSTSATIPAGAYFWAIKVGPTSVLADGSSLTEGDFLAVGDTAGQVATYKDGLVYANTAASTAVTAAVATKFDKSYTFPVNTLLAGDVLKVHAEAIITTTTGTETATLELRIGSTVIATTGAIDVANNDTFIFWSDLRIRTAGASGTIVGATMVNTATGSTTFKAIPLASTTIDTTATQEISVYVTFSSTGESGRLDILDITKNNINAAGLRAGIAIADLSGSGTPAQSRARVNCQW